MIFSKQEIIDNFLNQISESGINFVTNDEIENYIRVAFQRCYPQYHLRMLINYDIDSKTEADLEIDVPHIVQKIREIIILKDSTRNRNIRLTDWNLLPYINGANNRILVIHRELPECRLRILAQAILDYFTEDRIDVPSLEPIILYMTVQYYQKMKNEATRNRDKDSYVIYQNSKNDALIDFRESLNTNRMAQMFMQRRSDNKRKLIDLKNYVNNAQVIWSRYERTY